MVCRAFWHLRFCLPFLHFAGTPHLLAFLPALPFLTFLVVLHFVCLLLPVGLVAAGALWLPGPLKLELAGVESNGGGEGLP